jgi:hypothetical protein
MLAICIGVAATLAWQSYGQVTKQIIATRAPELGWSPKAKQTIASWVEQLGWTKPLAVESEATPVTQTAPETVASKDPAASSLDPQQVQQIALDVAALRQSVEQVAASQTKMAATINNLLLTDMGIFLKIPTPPQPAAALSHKPIPAAPPSPAPNRRTDVTPNKSLADSFRN